METSIKGIIEKIKKEGVERAGEEEAKILLAAKEQSAQLLKNAEKQKADILRKAESDAEKLKANAETALRQAARDVVLGLRGEIVSLFDSIVKREVGEALDADTMKKMMVLLAEKFTAEGTGEIEAILNEKNTKEMGKIFAADFKKELVSGISLSSSKEVAEGFRIGEKDSGVYYDFTDEAISEELSSYLNKGLLEILSGGNNNE